MCFFLTYLIKPFINHWKDGDFLVILRLQNQNDMIKRTLITCYLVLCTFFSFAQDKGKVVLEIPMDLSSSYFGGGGYHGYLIQNQEKSKYALLARDKSNVYLSVIDAQFNLRKNIEYSQMRCESCILISAFLSVLVNISIFSTNSKLSL